MKYVVSQSFTLLVMTAQLIYIILCFDKVEGYKEQIENFECTTNDFSSGMHQLYIYYVLFFEFYIPTYAFFLMTLFCCQLC